MHAHLGSTYEFSPISDIMARTESKAVYEKIHCNLFFIFNINLLWSFLILTFKLDTLRNWVSVSMAEAQPRLVGTETFATAVTRQFKLWMNNALSVRRQKMKR